jgi:phosphoglycolate phosphatase
VECLQLSADECGLPIPTEEQGRHIIGLGLKEALMELFPDISDAEVIQLREVYSRIYVGLDKEPSSFYPGVMATLDQLQQEGYLLAVATGKSRRGYERVLKAHGLDGFFHGSRCADETASKPHPRMLLELLSETATDPDSAWMVGDTTFDMAMARNARVHPVAVTYGAHEVRRLQSFDPLACLPSLDAMHALLNGELE